MSKRELILLTKNFSVDKRVGKTMTIKRTSDKYCEGPWSTLSYINIKGFFITYLIGRLYRERSTTYTY